MYKPTASNVNAFKPEPQRSLISKLSSLLKRVWRERIVSTTKNSVFCNWTMKSNNASSCGEERTFPDDVERACLGGAGGAQGVPRGKKKLQEWIRPWTREWYRPAE